MHRNHLHQIRIAFETDLTGIATAAKPALLFLFRILPLFGEIADQGVFAVE